MAEMTKAMAQSLERSIYEDSFYEFFKRAWKEIEHKPLSDNWHIKELCDIYQAETERIARGDPRDRHIMINICPRSSKSRITAVMWNAWAWTRFPWMKFMTLSYSGTRATNDAIKTKEIIRSSWYQSFWGHVFQMSEEKDTNSHFINTQHGERYAVGVGGSITGEGADIIVCDDIVSVQESQSKKVRDHAHYVYKEALANRLNDPEIGVKVVINQRTHADDVCGKELKENPEEYHLYKIPGRISENIHAYPPELEDNYVDRLFDPGRFPHVTLDRYEKTMVDYGEQYNQDPKKEGGNIIKKDWFFKYSIEELFERAERNVREENGDWLRWCFEIDGAYTNKTHNDPTVVLCYCYYKGRWYIRNRLKVWMTIVDLAEYLQSWVRMNGYTNDSIINIEPKASGKDLVDIMVQTYELNAAESFNPTGDKVQRAFSVTPILKAGRVGVPDDADWAEDYFKELEGFPKVDHDDQVDVTVQMIKNGEGSGGIISYG